MPDNKHSPKGELCKIENIGVYKFNVICIKSDELQLLKTLSANKVAILCYTGRHRRKGPNFGRVFLMLNYTDITQNTYIQS